MIFRGLLGVTCGCKGRFRIRVWGFLCECERGVWELCRGARLVLLAQDAGLVRTWRERRWDEKWREE